MPNQTDDLIDIKNDVVGATGLNEHFWSRVLKSQELRTGLKIQRGSKYPRAAMDWFVWFAERNNAGDKAAQPKTAHTMFELWQRDQPRGSFYNPDEPPAASPPVMPPASAAENATLPVFGAMIESANARLDNDSANARPRNEEIAQSRNEEIAQSRNSAIAPPMGQDSGEDGSPFELQMNSFFRRIDDTVRAATRAEMPPPPDHLLTCAEAAEILRMSPRSVRRHPNPHLKGFLTGTTEQSRRWRDSDVRRFIKGLSDPQ